jgi:hypothetical protein
MPYENVEKDTDIVDLMAYERIPSVKEELISQFEKIKKGSLGQSIDRFQDSRRDFYVALYRDNPGRRDDNVYWFELIRYSEMEWRIHHLKPDPPPFTPAVRILPQDIIRQITDSRVDPEQQVSIKAVDPLQADKTVDIDFVRYSYNYIFGIMTRK